MTTVQTTETIRRATQDDARSIIGLVNAAYSPYISRIGKQPAPMLDDYRQVIAQTDTFVLTQGAENVAVLVMSVEDDAELLLINIAVLPRCAGQGIGKRLMAYCEQHARRAGCRAIRLYTHELMTENIAIYSKLGFQETHRAVENGFARVFMRKVLDA